MINKFRLVKFFLRAWLRNGWHGLPACAGGQPAQRKENEPLGLKACLSEWCRPRSSAGLVARRHRLVACATRGWLLWVSASVLIFNTQAATYTTPRALSIGDIYELRRDGWYDPSGGQAYEGDVLPKTDPNTGTSRDILYYRRHNVARAWPTDTGYWFTGPDQHEGEPDPAGEQWVDYEPPVAILGPGRYSISASYRWAASRASYPAVYTVHHATGTNEVLRDQRIGSPSAAITYFSLGEFELRPGSFVRVMDTGTESITFGNMRFRLVAAVPRLQITPGPGWVMLRWPTNAPAYRLESSDNLGTPNSWAAVSELPTLDDDAFAVWLSTSEERKYFRLVAP